MVIATSLFALLFLGCTQATGNENANCKDANKQFEFPVDVDFDVTGGTLGSTTLTPCDVKATTDCFAQDVKYAVDFVIANGADITKLTFKPATGTDVLELLKTDFPSNIEVKSAKLVGTKYEISKFKPKTIVPTTTAEQSPITIAESGTCETTTAATDCTLLSVSSHVTVKGTMGSADVKLTLTGANEKKHEVDIKVCKGNPEASTTSGAGWLPRSAVLIVAYLSISFLLH